MDLVYLQMASTILGWELFLAIFVPGLALLNRTRRTCSFSIAPQRAGREVLEAAAPAQGRGQAGGRACPPGPLAVGGVGSGHVDCDPQMGTPNVSMAMKSENGLGRLVSSLSTVALPPCGTLQRIRRSLRQHPAGPGSEEVCSGRPGTVRALQQSGCVFKDALPVSASVWNSKTRQTLGSSWTLGF